MVNIDSIVFMTARRGECDFSDQSKLEISSFYIKRTLLKNNIGAKFNIIFGQSYLIPIETTVLKICIL